MNESPVLDERSQADLLAELQTLTDAYTESWDPESTDYAWTILRIFSQFGADVIRRLNDVPEKQRLAFLDALDFDRRPPKAARVPLSFSVASDLDRNVTVPGGTQALAASGEGETRTFEVPGDRGFEATSARLTDVLAVDPGTDTLLDHSDVLDGDDPVELFSGTDRQRHVLYLGHESLLTLDSQSAVTLTAETDSGVDLFSEPVVWEYYGEDADGEAGWHRLERPTEAETDVEAVDIDALRESVRSRSGPADEESTAEARFRLSGPTLEHEVNGVQSRWLRCRLEDEDPSYFATTVRSLSVSVGHNAGDGGLDPDSLLANDVPLSLAEDIRPFGRLPQPPATFYVAAEEAFTKHGGLVDIRFDPPETVADDGDDEGSETASDPGGVGVVGGPPVVSWEYWNGDGWTRIEGLTDETDALRSAGHVRFPVPEDIEETAVNGHDDVWIRARLVSGNYGQPTFDVTDDGTRGGMTDEPDAPTFGDVTVRYDRGHQPFETILRYDNDDYTPNLADADSFAPFVGLAAAKQTVYLGFDGTLRDGPLTLFVPVQDVTYPRAFDPGVQWEYCTDPEADEWAKLDVRDQTGGLTERGIVRLTFPEATAEHDCFGRERHWVRARVTQDEFTLPEADPSATVSGPVDAGTAVERTTTPPTIDGLYPNTQWAYNTETIEDEILGSSDGSHEQSLRCAYAPVIDAEVWVDELSTLSASERRRLRDAEPERVETVTNVAGEVTAFWIAWTEVEDFLDSEATDRHYVLDRGNGTVTFGDGDRGAIPPGGQDNVRATYTTGGGSDGNVEAGTVTDLKSSISLVESVSNPKPADGGADIESMDALVERATNRIRHRGRAVTERDYEQVAMAEFRELSTVKCDPDLGDSTGGGVTVLVVPQAERDRPVPSMELKGQVGDALRECAPASLVESGDAGIVVRGPSYAEIGVEVTVRATEIKSVSLLKRTIERRLDDYLHPLEGDEGTGWDFGDAPALEDIARVVSGVEDVSDIVEVGATVAVNGERHSLTGQDVAPDLPRDTLVCSGDHAIAVTMGGSP